MTGNSIKNWRREQLLSMLSWYVGTKTGFKANTGMAGKHLAKHLEPDLWSMLEQTYSSAIPGETWDALVAMCDLFRKTAVSVAGHLDYPYPYGDDARMSAHLTHVRALPRGATEIY